MRVSVFGLGYVGCVTAACLASDGHAVTGVDVNASKVQMVTDGQSPVVEKDLKPLISAAVAAGRLFATLDPVKAIMESDLSLVSVGTPPAHNGGQDLTYLRRVSAEIGEALTSKNGYHYIAIRSTVLPGTTEEVVIPLLEQVSGKVVGRDFGVCVNPEFMREGNSVHDFYNPPFIIVGETVPDGSAETVADLFQTVVAPVIRTSARVAEMIKYVNNAWHALKVTFANEVGTLCKVNSVDSHELMDIFCLDTALNISTAYLKPGFAFGGSCLPKELRALEYQARHVDLCLPLLESILRSNEAHLQRALQLIARTGKHNVGLVGLSFKAGTDDLRESPLVTLAERLIGKGYHLRIYDPGVSLARLTGANKEYIERGAPHIARLLVASPDELLHEAEVVVVGHTGEEVDEVIGNLREGQIVIDLVRAIDNPSTLDSRYEGICW